jgi:transglutaminase-like putative cysteine protease
MNKYLATVFLVLLVNSLWGQARLPLTANQIPDSLKKDVDAVYQLEEMICSIESPSSYKRKVHNIITILSKQGKKHGIIQVGADKFNKFDEAEVTIYDANGKEFKRYKKRDFKVYGANDASTMASDDKIYDLDYIHPEFPFTIEVSHTTFISSYLDLPSWFFATSDASLITSRFVIETKDAQQIRYKVYNSNMQPVISNNGGITTYTWEMNNRKKPYSEPGCYGRVVTEPWIDVSPVNFKYDGYAGSLSNWNEFGKMFYPFYEEANPFTPARKAFFQSIADKGNTRFEKIKLLYNYLQQETRYVSIQFGIGGYKPFPVSFAEEKKYGDCKGLTHYMKHMLQAVGIKAYGAVINAGANEYPVDPGFASNKFNHIILCVPDGKDTVWLECTSKDNYAGVLGAFTENRNALLLTEKGGVLVRTPDSKAENNQWKSHTAITLYEDGSAVTRSRVFVSGEFWTPFFYLVSGKSKDDIKKFLVQHLQFKTPDDLEVKILNDSADGHNIEMTLAYSQYFDFKTGSKYFLPCRPFKLNDETIKPAETRTTDYLFDFPYTKTDTTVFYLPGSFKPESMPADARFSKEFVDYERKLKVNEPGTTVTLASRLVLTKHIIPPALYNSTAKEFELIRKDENQKLVLKKE